VQDKYLKFELNRLDYWVIQFIWMRLVLVVQKSCKGWDVDRVKWVSVKADNSVRLIKIHMNTSRHYKTKVIRQIYYYSSMTLNKVNIYMLFCMLL